MWHWNELQPGGQGLAADFNLYFRSLNDANKEVHFPDHVYITRITHLSIALQKGDVCCARCKGKYPHVLQHVL
jgi:hypothetical protein